MPFNPHVKRHTTYFKGGRPLKPNTRIRPSASDEAMAITLGEPGVAKRMPLAI